MYTNVFEGEMGGYQGDGQSCTSSIWFRTSKNQLRQTIKHATQQLSHFTKLAEIIIKPEQMTSQQITMILCDMQINGLRTSEVKRLT